MSETGSLQDCRILVVEDDFVIAQVVLDVLEEAGAVPLGPIGTVESALAFIDANATSLDRVVLDLDLHGRKSYPVAERLAALNVPFVFASGYSHDTVDSAYRTYPHCEKPIRRATLLGLLAA
jgi:CheY-like chemotaxis protein